MPRNNGEQSPKPETATPKRASMTQEHKDALAEGRRESRVVKDYLATLKTEAPRRGRPVDEKTIASRLEKVESELATTDSPIKRLTLIQKRRDYSTQLEQFQASGSEDEIRELERQFVKMAKPFAERRGITYATFREAGVPSSVLKEAGLVRS